MSSNSGNVLIPGAGHLRAKSFAGCPIMYPNRPLYDPRHRDLRHARTPPLDTSLFPLSDGALDAGHGDAVGLAGYAGGNGRERRTGQ